MEFEEIEFWLKNTIPGIILLGALGSVVAAVAIMLINKMLMPVAKKGFINVAASSILHFILPATKQLVRLHFLEGQNKISVFYVLQVMKLSFSLFVATCAFIVFMFSIFQSEENFFKVSILVPLIVYFLGVWYALRCTGAAFLPMYVDIEKLIAKAKAEKEKELKDKNG
jgi:hypothetical protein